MQGLPAMPESRASVRDSGSLASSTATRQRRQLTWSLSGIAVVSVGYAIAVVLFRAGLATVYFPETVLWCIVPFAVAAHWLYRAAGLPASERRGVLLVTTAIPFLLTPLGFALLQHPYSRGAVLLTYALSMAWFFAGDKMEVARHAPRLAYLDAGIPALLDRLLGSAPVSLSVSLVPWATNAVGQLAEIDGVVVDRGVPAGPERGEVLRSLKLNHIRLYSVEAVAELLSGRKMLTSDEHELWQLDGNPAYDLVKRFFDVAAVVATLPVWLPLCAIVALAVKLDTPGPALFRQNRVGLNGRCFQIWKFRSMRHEGSNQQARFAANGDTRVTRVGRVIRRWRLDELPQVVNVLLGQMSLIGPRPEQQAFVDAFAAQIRAYPYRHLVRPGLTGWAQVQQGYAEGEDEAAVKLSYDLYYVAHYSMALDLLITYKTVRTILSGFGAR
jgi:lipopolysaccharide/colanic/teichoic acid biosynthesis glycosyltransferase